MVGEIEEGRNMLAGNDKSKKFFTSGVAKDALIRGGRGAVLMGGIGYGISKLMGDTGAKEEVASK